MKKYISKQTFLRVKNLIFAHKITSAVVIIIIVGAGYYGYGKLTATAGETRYLLTTVGKGTIISSVSGSGQVSATNQIDIKAKVSGDITWVGAKTGQVVHAGQALAGIDNRTAQASVDDAEAALIQAKLQYQKDQVAAPIDYQTALDNLTNAKNDLATGYNDTFNSLSTTYLDLPNVVIGMQNILYGFDLSSNHSQWNVNILKNLFVNEALAKVQAFSDSAENDYKPARDKYNAALTEYKQTSRTGDVADIEKLLADSIDTTTAVAQALQSELNFLAGVIDVANQYNIPLPAMVTTMQTNARNYLSTTNSDLSSLLAQKKAIDAAKQTINTNEHNIELLKVGNETGSNPISLQIEQNNLVRQERDLENLKTNLGYYTVIAPFAGIISSVTAQVGDSAGTIASIITNQQVAELSLNEIDATKVSLGQKATLTFDAISDLSLTGTVAEIDPVGTVSQGVVSYTVKITFDTMDSRIKPGMTANASIQSEIHQNVLYVPSSAVKTSNGQSYVLVFEPVLSNASSAGVTSTAAPVQIPVQTGISDDTNIEILSGLTDGQQIVSRTITSAAATKASATPSATSILSGGNNRGGGIRIAD